MLSRCHGTNFGRSSQSTIDDDVALRWAAADQRIAFGWRLDELGKSSIPLAAGF
jgi:hypothetical protein